MKRLALVFLAASCAPAAASSVYNHAPAPAYIDELEKGLRFIGKREDFKIYAVNSGAKDQETMYAAVRKGQEDRPAAFFRAGAAQCFEGKYGGAPIPCETPDIPQALGSGYKLQPALWASPAPRWNGGRPGNPGGGSSNPPIVIEPPEEPCCVIIDPEEPPIVEPPEPPTPSPIPGPWAMVNLLSALALTAGLGWYLTRFAGSYEENRRLSCGDPDLKV